MKTLLPAFLMIMLTATVSGQRRSDLLAEIDTLNARLGKSQEELYTVQRQLRSAETKATQMEEQVDQLKETNEGLLKNLNNFIEASAQKTSNIGKTIDALNRREAQLKKINDQFSAHDSLAFLVLTDLKRSLGENAKIGMENGAVMIKLDNSTTFKGDNAVINAPAKDYIGKIAAVARKYPDLAVTIESMGLDKLEYLAKRSAAVSDLMETSFEINPERLQAQAKSGLTDGTFIKLHPKFTTFYLWMREQMKNNL